jgi:hypothetical protein
MWIRVINIILGIWLMAAPAVLDYGEPARTNSYIVGPLAASFATIAIWEATRSVRWVNVVLGLWLIVAPLVLGYRGSAAINGLIVGPLLAVLALLPGKITGRYGGGWSALWSTSAFGEE